MKYSAIIFGLIGIIGIIEANYAFGMWEPETPVRLFEQSQTVFVGIITSVNPIEFERSNSYNVEENGIPRTVVENYTQTLDQYTVNIEEFVKNPQEFHTITMLEATVGGVPGMSVSIGGFELGDRVLFYVPKLDGTNQYSPESFKIPENCEAQSLAEMPRMQMGDSFSIIQEGIERKDNLIANKSAEFVYQKDMRTLDAKSFDFQITIRKKSDTGNFDKSVLSERIQSESKPCQWISTAKVEFIPQKGQYEIWANIIEDTSTQTFARSFSVDDVEFGKIQSPLKQFNLGISVDKIKCKDNLVLIQKYDGSPACVKPESILNLIERGWAQNTTQENISSMMERGNIAMGFNQTRIMHHFMATPTGGKIMIVAINENDTKTINEIRDHVKDIEYEFSQGNFTKPFFIHDQIVPGAQAMAENKDKIQYSTMQIDRGSVLILATNDTELLDSIQQFMDFQSSQHIGH